MSARSLLLLAAIAAGVSYMASWGLALPFWAATAWKGAGVALLALYAATRARSLDGWLLVAVMALGAAGDVLLETNGLMVGAMAFAGGHLLASYLYLRNIRPRAGWWEAVVFVGIFALTGGLTLLIVPRGPQLDAAANYVLALSLMAAMAWLSRFPRPRVAAGALMFVVSDLLIFARAGALHGQAWASDAVWILYFSGQTLICIGVADTLSDVSIEPSQAAV